MLRVVEQWYGTDVGRQRQGNEDSFFVQVPLFVVADGMGGAQAGEVASRLAVEAFHDGLDGPGPLEAMVGIIREANHRIHDRSRADAKHHGMGTTLTAAFVAADEVVLAHVGDSRCYLLRAGELTRLTRDHSLVGELVDRGKLTEEQAEVHPQRSVITRALGPEDQVEVDTERIVAREGDLFLLCSDGLTSMVREHDLLPILQGDAGLDRIGRELINAANAAGGRDNITVVLFRVGEVDAPGGPARTDQTTEQGSVGAEDRPTAPGPAATRASDEQEAAYRSQGTVAMAALDPPPVAEPHARRAGAVPERTAPPPAPRGRRPAPRRSRLRRVLVPFTVALVLLGFVALGAWVAIRGVFFVGVDDRRVVSIYRGLPYELPFGIELYTRDYTSGVTIDQVPPARRGTFTNHKLRSNTDAQDLVRALETGNVR